MQKLELNRKSLRKFGITMGIAFLVIAALIFLRRNYWPLPAAVISIIFFLLSLLAPFLLKPIYILWMRLALVLAWVNTRLILTVMFYLVFTPIGLMMRLFKVDLLDRKIDKNKESYWKAKEKAEFSRLNYERQF